MVKNSSFKKFRISKSIFSNKYKAHWRNLNGGIRTTLFTLSSIQGNHLHRKQMSILRKFYLLILATTSQSNW